MANLQTLIDKSVAGGGSETGLMPAGWLPPDTSQYASTLISGIDAIEQYKNLPQNLIGGATGTVQGWMQGIEIPKWASDIASTGGLWLPMALESSSLVAAVEAVANKAFGEISNGAKQLGQFGNIASLAKTGIAVAGDVLALVDKLQKDLSIGTIVQSVSDLVNNVATVVADLGKALNYAKELVADAFAAIPFCGAVASFIAQGVAMLIEYLTYPRAAVEQNMLKADQEAGKRIDDLCKSYVVRDTRPVATSYDSSKQQAFAGPADLFRPVSYWVYACSEAYTKGSGGYRNPFGGRGFYNEPKFPPPPMTPVFLYVSLCGDAVPPMLRGSTCGAWNYQSGWRNHRYMRDPGDCYTASVARLQPKYGKNFGIPLQTRKLMWKIIQALLGCVKTPMLAGLSASAKDDGKTLYSTLQQICYNEYLAGRINEELLLALNNDIVSKHGFVEGNFLVTRYETGGMKSFSISYPGAASCRDAGVRLDKQFLDELQKFSLAALNQTIETKDGKKNFYSNGKWQFDARLMGGKKPKGQLVVRAGAAQTIIKGYMKVASVKSLGDSMGPELRDRLADGTMPWTSVLSDGGIPTWMALRGRARGVR